MQIQKLVEKLRDRLLARWISCRIVSDKRSALYGIYFSYPVYISIVVSGILLKNPYLLCIAALVALFGIILPVHPFDYIYNYGVANLLGTKKIPGRGSELQVNSTVAFIFNLIVLALITLGVGINYVALAIIYVLASIFFVGIFLFKD